jgi:hypothetical protein
VERRTFLKIGAAPPAAMLVPVFGNAIAAEELLNPMAVQFKKSLADAALNAATKAGASYCDVRIGRYLNQFITTRDLNVQNIVNTESSGVGVRVIAGGAYGFADQRHESRTRWPTPRARRWRSPRQRQAADRAGACWRRSRAWAKWPGPRRSRRTGARCRSRKRPRC